MYSFSRLFWMRRRRRRSGLEALHQEGGVHNEGYRKSDQSVHKNVQLWLSKSVLSKPLEHFVFVHDVTWKSKRNIRAIYTFLIIHKKDGWYEM